MENIHERDARITFDPIHHIYHIDGIQCLTSTTGLVGKFFPEFDAVGTVEKYYDNWQRRSHDKYGGLTKQQILELWDQDGEASSELGTRLHEAIETYYKGGVPNIEGVEADYGLFLAFRKDHMDLKPYRIEWRIGTNPDIGIAGTIDMCFIREGDPPGVIHIYDWKRTRKEIVKTGFRGETGTGPLAHIQNSNYYHYCIQLNTYKYILETFYGLKVASMYFITLHSVRPQYGKHEVIDFQKEVRHILQLVKNSRN